MAGAIGFVTPRHAWLRDLYAELRRARVPLDALVLGDGVLRLGLGGDGPAPLRVVVRPKREGAEGYGATERFMVGFEGAADLARTERERLDRVLSLLRGLDPRMPESLAGFAAICAPSGDGEADLRRLFPFLDVERTRGDAGAGDAGRPGGSRDAGEERVEVLVRATSRCNQACPFCSAPAHDQPSAEALLACFDAVSRWLPGATLTLTGGEPTLRPRFVDEVTTARSFPGVARVHVQSNAVLFADRVDPAAMPPGEDLTFFVSLHAIEDGIYDACTGTQGQLPRALAGVRRLLGAGHGVTLNTVVTRDNLGHLEVMVGALPALLSTERLPSLHLSALMCPERRPAAEPLLVPFGELVPALQAAVAGAEARGLKVESLLSSTHAVVPACVLPNAREAVARRARARIAAHETGYEPTDTPWVKAPGCRGCTETAHCLGVPRAYARRFGLGELSPLEGAATP